MEDFTAFIGREKICRGEETKRLYDLEDQSFEYLKRAAQELRRLLSNSLPEDEAQSFSLAEELFVLLDTFRPESIQAATAFLTRYGKHVMAHSTQTGLYSSTGCAANSASFSGRARFSDRLAN